MPRRPLESSLRTWMVESGVDTWGSFREPQPSPEEEGDEEEGDDRVADRDRAGDGDRDGRREQQRDAGDGDRLPAALPRGGWEVALDGDEVARVDRGVHALEPALQFVDVEPAGCGVVAEPLGRCLVRSGA